MQPRNKTYNALIAQFAVVLLGLICFIPGLGSVHLFDWDEINFAESAREMLASGDYLNVQINFEQFWEKPPLFIWMQALAMRIFGVNEFAARFPNAICGVVTLLVLFNIGRQLRGMRLGWLWVLLYIGSITPFFYFKSGIIDPWFNLFIFLGIYYFAQFTQQGNRSNGYVQVALSALFLGLAILTKGPAALLIFLLTFGVYLIAKRFHLIYTVGQVALFAAIVTVVGGFWFMLQIASGNLDVIQDFITYQIRLFETKDAGHGGFLLYHFVVLLVGVFPASLFAIAALCRRICRTESNSNVAHFYRWMVMLLCVVLVLFTIVQTKIVHYSSLCFFPLSFLGACYAERMLCGKQKASIWLKVALLVMGVLFALIICIIPFFDNIKPHILPLVDEFTRGNLQANSQWNGFEWLLGVVLLIGVVHFALYSHTATKRALVLLFASSAIYVGGAMLMVVPQVEKYTQGAIIEFYEQHVGEECYILSTYKSYAPYFYAKRKAENNASNEEWLCSGAIDKPCYFVVRCIAEQIDEFETKAPEATLLYKKNGFAFYVRQPIAKQNSEL